MDDQEANFRQIALHQAAHDHKGMSPATRVVEDAKIYYAFLRADGVDPVVDCSTAEGQIRLGQALKRADLSQVLSQARQRT